MIGKRLLLCIVVFLLVVRFSGFHTLAQQKEASIYLKLYGFINDVEFKLVGGVRLIVFKNGALFGREAFLKYSPPRLPHTLWMNGMSLRKPFHDTVVMVWSQLKDLAERLDRIREGKAFLIRQYGESEVGKQLRRLDKDAQDLSKLGWRLIEATRSFYPSVRHTMKQLDLARVREKALAGLKSFNQDIENIKRMTLESVDQNIKMVVEAMKKLENAVNE